MTHPQQPPQGPLYQGPPQPYQGPPAPPQPPYGAQPIQTPGKKPKRFGWLALGVSALAGLVLGSCSGAIAAGGDTTTVGAPAPASTVTVTAPAAPPSSEPATEPTQDATDEPVDEPAAGEAGIKDTYAWEDGVEAKITKVEHRKISDNGAGGRPGEPMVVLTFKVTNKSNQNLDGDLFSADVTYGKDGEPAESVFDLGVGEGISGTVGKGRSKSGEYAYAIPTKQQGDVLVEVSPGFDYSSGVFAGSVK